MRCPYRYLRLPRCALAGAAAFALSVALLPASAAETPATSSMRVIVDPDTGQLRLPTASELKQAPGAPSAAQSEAAPSDQPVVRYHANGMKSMVLDASQLEHLHGRPASDGSLFAGHASGELRNSKPKE